MSIAVISLGGSNMVPDKINTEFLKEFCTIIRSHVEKDMRFVIVTGGGRLAREYQAAAKELADPSHEELDWIGIYTTRVNAQLVRVLLSDIAEKEINITPDDVKFEKQVLIGAGAEPGASSDIDAVKIAVALKAKYLINISNTEYVYDSDPRKNPDAKKLEMLTWDDLQKIVGDKFTPGLNAPFDPEAVKIANKNNLTAYLLGPKLVNLEHVLSGEEFVGTTVTNN